MMSGKPVQSSSTRPAAVLLACLGLGLPGAAGAHAQTLPTEPPAHWGPVSISLEDVPYPHPVSFVEFTLYGEQVRMAFMDVAAAERANGQAVALLHGGNYFAKAWEGTIEALRDAGFRVVAIDQIGYGRSSKPLVPYSLDMHAANTKRVLDHLGLERVAVVGHSMGGMLAARFAFSYPDATTHLVMVNPIGLTDARMGRPWTEPQANLDRPFEAALNTIRGHVVTWDDTYLEYVRIHYGWTLSGEWPRLATIRALNSQVMQTPVVYDWPHIQAPALVIGGREDGPRFPELARNAAETLPNGRLLLFPGVGHNPHWEAQDLLHPALIGFLRGEREEPTNSGR
jgi:pimeloyl-ACP methyl ester carboxylesterase